MPRPQARVSDEQLEQRQESRARRVAAVEPARLGSDPAGIMRLQRLAGNEAVADLLAQQGEHIQRADGGTAPVATADAGAATDSDVDGLDLQSDVANAAKALKSKVPAVRFTSGRRSLEEDSSAVAANIVANRNYVDTFVDSEPKKLIKTWVDAHPTATKAEITDAIVTILEPMNETKRSYWSLHLGGRAFDISPSSCTLAEVQAVFPQALREETHWHVQFVSAWKP